MTAYLEVLNMYKQKKMIENNLIYYIYKNIIKSNNYFTNSKTN
jgi:hypothetical protein